MKKLSLLLSLIFCFISPIFSQSQFPRIWNPSINSWQFSAGVDGALGVITNPAVLGLYNETDLWYTAHMQNGNFLEHNFIVTTPFVFTNFSADYRKAFDNAAKNSADAYGFGFGIGSSAFAVGYNADYLVSKNTTATLSNFGILFRPNRMLSLSFVVKNFNAPSVAAYSFPREETFGVGIRPFKNDRISFFADMKSASPTFLHDLNFNAGVDVRVTSGVHLLAAYHEFKGVKEPLYTVGVRFDFSQSSILGIVNATSNQTPGTSFGIHLSNMRQETTFPQQKRLAEISIRGDYEDFDEPPLFFFSEKKKGLQSLIAELDRAANDESVAGVLLNIEPFSTSYGSWFGMNGSLQELTRAVERVQAKGKPVVAFCANTVSLQELYLASAADKIIVPQYALIYGYGISFNSLRYKYALKKLGIDVRTYTAGKYKSALNVMGDTLSEWKIQELNTLVDDLYAEMLVQLKKGRNGRIPENMLDTLSGFMQPEQAKAANIVDGIGWYADAKKQLFELAMNAPIESGDDVGTISMNGRAVHKTMWNEPPSIAVIGVYGGITQGMSSPPGGLPLPMLEKERTTGSVTVVQQLEEAKNDDDIKAVILRVDSPGGDGIASDDIYREIQKVREKKLVVVSMASMATSGGYYVSSTGAKIFANPATLTASIGVISQVPFFYEMFDSINIYRKNFSRGTYSAFLNLYEPPSPEGEGMLKNALNVFLRRIPKTH